MIRINSADEFKSLIKERKYRYSNSTLMFNRVARLAEEGRISYQKNDNGLLFLVDEGTFYKGYYYWNDREFNIEKVDKPILIEEPDANDRRSKDIQQFQNLLFARGFRYVKKSYQLEKKLSQDIIYDCVIPEGLKLRYTVSEEEYRQVLELWDNYLEKEDIRADDRLFLDREGYRNLTMVNQQNEPVCTLLSIWSKNRAEIYHLVTRKDYQGRGLARLIYQSLLNDMTDHGIGRITAWVSSENRASLNLHDKLNFVRNGKTSIQYSLEED